jgi:molybdopterin converting factor subunit 1
MRVVVRLFAVARERAGAASVVLDVGDPVTVGSLKRALREQVPELAPMLASFMVAVDSEYADEARVIQEGEEVAVIPPVSGGASS